MVEELKLKLHNGTSEVNSTHEMKIQDKNEISVVKEGESLEECHCKFCGWFDHLPSSRSNLNGPEAG
ncbi:hypothetical protein SLA2020_152060 [Shorea laevis]